jgi:DNA helicase-2/ATP-dependent DNA helicase PcrA
MFNSTVRNIMILAFNKSVVETVNVRIRNPRALPPRTAYQKAICLEIMKRQDHVVVNALAGTGKTITIEQSVSDFPGANVRVQTCHGFGFGAHRYHVRQHGINEVDVNEDKVGVILRQLTNVEFLNANDKVRAEQKIGPAKRLVSLFKSQGFIAIRPEATNEDCIALCDRYDVELPDPTEIPETEIFDLARQALTVSNREISIIDYDDMIYLPVLLRASFAPNDIIYVDESQDLNPIRIALIKLAANSKCQVVCVGDRNQAIYGFTGADTEAIDSVVKMFNSVELPLSTCWRCPTSVITEAQKIVPQIEAAPNAIEGSVITLKNEDEMMKLAEAGDFVLCRTTAPLVDTCMQLIRHGKAATVRGRDIGKGLENLCDKIRKRRTSKGKELVDALVAYREDQASKLSHPSKEAQLMAMGDKVDTLLVLSEECTSFDDLKKKINSIFSDAQNGELKGLILCSTCHKAKGLEADRVFIIHPELLPGPWARQAWQIQQERNLKYVATTRAMRELYWVPNAKTKKAPETVQEASIEKTAPKANSKPKKARKSTARPRKATATK